MFCFTSIHQNSFGISPVVATSKAACFEVAGSVPCRHATELTAFGVEQMEISLTKKKWWINVDFINLSNQFRSISGSSVPQAAKTRDFHQH